MLIRCKALRAFTQFVPGHGQVHGDPDNQDERVSFPEVPESYVQFLADEGKIEAPEPTLEEMCAAIADAIGSADVDPDATDEPKGPLFTVTHAVGPNFDVFGPGMDAPERVKGKAAAEELAAKLEAEYAEASLRAAAIAVEAAEQAATEGEGEGETATEDAAPV